MFGIASFAQTPFASLAGQAFFASVTEDINLADASVQQSAFRQSITELVSHGANGEIEGFQYERLTVVLLKAIQEQQAIIQSLTARIEALEGK